MPPSWGARFNFGDDILLQHGGVVDGDSVVTCLVLWAAEGWRKGLWRLEKNVSVDET